MSELSAFLKGNKKKRQNGYFPATKSLCDPETGEPLMWEIKPLTTKENEEIRDDCLTQRQTPNGGFEMCLDPRKYLARITAACVVFPDLLNAELQDSYGVKTPEALLQEMIDDPDEYSTFTDYVYHYNGFEDIEELKEQAKN